MRAFACVILLLAALALGTWLGVREKPAPSVAGPVMRLHFIDVGEGDSILIESPDGKRMLVDAGEEAAGGTVISYLRAKGARRLEFLVMSHPHSDHIGGMPEILGTFPVQCVMDSGYPHGSRIQERVLEQIEGMRIPYLVAYAGQSYRLGSKVRVEVLSPPRELLDHTGSDANNNSLVLRVTYGSVSALLMGDAEREAEAALLAGRRNIESSILKVAHHGSSDSTSVELLRQVRPAFVVISVGARNEHGHPHRATLRRLSPEKLGAKLLRTDRNGTIVLSTDGENTIAEVSR